MRLVDVPLVWCLPGEISITLEYTQELATRERARGAAIVHLDEIFIWHMPHGKALGHAICAANVRKNGILAVRRRRSSACSNA